MGLLWAIDSLHLNSENISDGIPLKLSVLNRGVKTGFRTQRIRENEVFHIMIAGRSHDLWLSPKDSGVVLFIDIDSDGSVDSSYFRNADTASNCYGNCFTWRSVDLGTPAMPFAMQAIQEWNQDTTSAFSFSVSGTFVWRASPMIEGVKYELHGFDNNVNGLFDEGDHWAIQMETANIDSRVLPSSYGQRPFSVSILDDGKEIRIERKGRDAYRLIVSPSPYLLEFSNFYYLSGDIDGLPPPARVSFDVTNRGKSFWESGTIEVSISMGNDSWVTQVSMWDNRETQGFGPMPPLSPRQSMSVWVPLRKEGTGTGRWPKGDSDILVVPRASGTAGRGDALLRVIITGRWYPHPSERRGQ